MGIFLNALLPGNDYVFGKGKGKGDIAMSFTPRKSVDEVATEEE